MIRFVRSARVKSAGKFVDALKFAKQLCAYSDKKYASDGSSGKVFVNIAGSGVITWMCDYPDLATFEKLQGAVISDAGYWAEEAKGDGLFDEGSVHELLMTEI